MQQHRRRIVCALASLAIAASLVVYCCDGRAVASATEPSAVAGDLPGESAPANALAHLHLSDAQRQQVEPIVREYLRRQSEARRIFLLQMKAILPAGQYAAFEDAMSKERAEPVSRPEVAGGQATTRPIAISGGHETDPRDRGRPVVLVAAGLGVTAEVFRDAFSHVTPAPAGNRPDPAQVNRNKEALMAALGKYGVTNDRLDTVSDYYRYNGRGGEMWRNRPAKAFATIREGKVIGITVTDAGAGYSSAPDVKIEGMPATKLAAKISVGEDLATNGCISEIKILPE